MVAFIIIIHSRDKNTLRCPEWHLYAFLSLGLSQPHVVIARPALSASLVPRDSRQERGGDRFEGVVISA